MATNVSTTLRTVLHQLTSQRARLDRQIGAVRAALDGAVSPLAPRLRQRRRSRGRMSAAARQEVSRRMKTYWAKRRAQAHKPAGSARKAPKRK
jgi:hypothetical protein